MPKAYSVFKHSVHNVSVNQLQQHDRNLLQKNTTVLSMNLWRKSFCIVDKMVFN